MKLSDAQRKTILELKAQPRAYVASMRKSLNALERKGLIQIVSQEHPLLQPVWGLTDRGRRAAVAIAAVAAIFHADALRKEEL